MCPICLSGLFHHNISWLFFPLGEITPPPFSNSPLQRRIDPLVHPGWGVSERAWLGLMNWNPGEIFPSRVCLSWKSMGSMHVPNEKSTVSTPLFPSIRSSKSNLINLTFGSQSRIRETFFPGGDSCFWFHGFSKMLKWWSTVNWKLLVLWVMVAFFILK